MSATEHRGLNAMYFEQRPGSSPDAEALSVVKHFLQQENDLHGGLNYFDQASNKSLVLTLKPSPEEKIFKLGKDAYLVCLAMRSQEGEDYDVDFFEETGSGTEPSLSRIELYSVNGHPCYDWVDENRSRQQFLSS